MYQNRVSDIRSCQVVISQEVKTSKTYDISTANNRRRKIYIYWLGLFMKDDIEYRKMFQKILSS